VALKRFDEARAQARSAVTNALDTAWPIGILFALQHLAAADALEHLEPHRAARMLGYVDAGVERLKARREHTEQHERDAMLAALRESLDDDQLVRLMAEGAAWSEEDALAAVSS
jgi:hypothetical protein